MRSKNKLFILLLYYFTILLLLGAFKNYTINTFNEMV